MPKRKHTEENISSKIRKIEKLLKQCKSRRKRIISSSSEDSSQAPEDQNHGIIQSPLRCDTDMDSILLPFEQWLQEVETPPTPVQPPPTPVQPLPSTSQEGLSEQGIDLQINDIHPEESGLDRTILELLGDDPTTPVEYGKDIIPELAARFNHIATNGLKKDIRKELGEKYLIPGNCMLIGAPSLNSEIKVALNETTLKRDRLIESRQKRIAAALACIGEALTSALDENEKDNAQIKRLMDSARLICDIQYNDSVSRRNLAVYSLKREMKEPLLNTKIDKCLFGEQLTDSLKAAKAVAKSGTELKNQTRQPSKNWQAPVAGRRQPAAAWRQAPAVPTTPASRSAPPPPPPPPAPETAGPRNARAHWSRKPPPPPPKFTRRRY